VEGTVSGVKSAGIELRIEPGIMGFMPKSLSGIPKGENLAKTFETGKQIKVEIMELDVEKRRLILSATGSGESGDDYREYLDRQPEEQSGAFGSLGKLLSDALKKKQAESNE